MFSFPWSNFHELNLDWILSVVKEAKDIFVRGEGDIQHAVETADQALETAEQAAAGVIADGSVTIPKVNDDVFNLMAFIVSGSVNPVAIPAGSLVILRKSTVYNVGDGIYVAASDIPASSVLTAADLLQPSPLPDAGGLNYVMALLGDQIDDAETSINAIQRGLVTVVDGDNASSAVPAGALAYLKNNEHNLPEGLYANISNAPFPTTGGTADSTVFSAVSDVLNSLKTSLDPIEDAIAYVQDGDTAARTYTAGQFVYLKNHTLPEGLYTVNDNIPQGTSVTGHLTADTNGGLNSVYTASTSFTTSINGKRINSGSISTAFSVSGFQFDSGRILAYIPLPFIASNTNYGVTVTSCSLIGIGSIPISDVTIDSKDYNFIRIMISRSGTVGTPFGVYLGLSLDFN